jgi:hypothetical protein
VFEWAWYRLGVTNGLLMRAAARRNGIRMRTTRLIAVAVVCSAGVAGLAGCGGHKSADSARSTASSRPTGSASAKASPAPSKTPGIETLTAEQIYERSKNALRDASSLKMTFDGTSDKEHIFGHLALDRKGNCVGDIGMGSTGHFEIIKKGAKVWMKPDTAFWKTMGGKNGAAAAELFKGRYLTGPMSDSNLAGMSSFCSLDDMLKDIDEPDPTEKVTKGSLTTVDGVPAITLHDVTSDSSGDFYVATEGVPYILKADMTEDDGPVLMTFSDFDAPVKAVAPPADEVIDMTKLKNLQKGSAV